MPDTLDAPTQTVSLREDDRINLIRVLPQQAQSTDQSRAIRNLRQRLEPDFGEDVPMQQHPDGMVAMNGQAEEAEVELTDGEVSIIAAGVDQMEDAEQVPTSEPFHRLLDKIEPLIEETKNRGDDE